MHFSRSRVAVIATAGTAALLSLPVVALGQVPNLNGVVGGVTNQVPSLPAPRCRPLPALPRASRAPAGAGARSAPAPAPSAPPSLPAPLPALPKPGSGAPAAPARLAAPARPRARRRRSSVVPSPSAGRAPPGVSPANPGGPHAATPEDQRPSVRRIRRGARRPKPPARRTRPEPRLRSRLMRRDLPDNASPETVPFTGLQLALVAMAGLAALAAGAVMRHGTRIARR